MWMSAVFERSEFACRCGCGFAAVDVELLYLLERIRGEFGHPVRIHSGCRCPPHNAIVGGVLDSMHIKGMAVDFSVHLATPDKVARWLDQQYPAHYGIGRYDGFVHLDVRPEAARWGFE